MTPSVAASTSAAAVPAIQGLIHVLVRKRRELLLDNIADQFQRFQDLAEGKVHVHLKSARPVADEIRERIRKIAEEDHGQTGENRGEGQQAPAEGGPAVDGPDAREDDPGRPSPPVQEERAKGDRHEQEQHPGGVELRHDRPLPPG